MVKDVELIEIPEETPQSHRIAWWFENAFIRSIKRIINESTTQLRQIFSFSLSDFVEDYEKELIPFVEPLLQNILNTPGLPNWIRYPIEKALTGESQAGIAILFAAVAAIGSGLNQAIAPVIGRMIEPQLDSILRTRLFDPGTLVSLWQRKIITDDQLRRYLIRNGVSDEGIEALKQLSFRVEDEMELTQAFWRKNVDLPYVSRELSGQGYTSQQITHWLESRELIPSPTDLVSMATREAFNDATAQRFGYDDNYPAEAAQWAEKQGLGQQWFKRYWRAHWVLPGITQVREMWRRNIITESDVDAYLLAADLPTFWRTAILQWMTAEITRVDVRRLYALGVISIQDVFARYQRLGYSVDDSTLMTQWTAAEYLNEERELTKTDILTMFRDGVLSEQESTIYLESLDYRGSDISLLLAHQELKRDQAYESRIIEIVKELFIRGVINRTDVFSELGKIDTPGHFIEDSLTVWDLEKKRKIVKPTLTQLRDMVLGEVISQDEFVNELENKGYSNRYISWYQNLWFAE